VRPLFGVCRRYPCSHAHACGLALLVLYLQGLTDHLRRYTAVVFRYCLGTYCINILAGSYVGTIQMQGPISVNRSGPSTQSISAIQHLLHQMHPVEGRGGLTEGQWMLLQFEVHPCPLTNNPLIDCHTKHIPCTCHCHCYDSFPDHEDNKVRVSWEHKTVVQDARI
jgi:hypothetical protein